jgi:hypothetical protein
VQIGAKDFSIPIPFFLGACIFQLEMFLWFVHSNWRIEACGVLQHSDRAIAFFFHTRRGVSESETNCALSPPSWVTMTTLGSEGDLPNPNAISLDIPTRLPKIVIQPRLLYFDPAWTSQSVS